MKPHIIQTVRQWKYVLNAASACVVKTRIDGADVRLLYLPEGGSASFYTNSKQVIVETDGSFEILPCAKDHTLIDQTYAPDSHNAQSGTAVARALQNGSVKIHLPETPHDYEMTNGSTIELEPHTDTWNVCPRETQNVLEMRVLYSPDEARTTPLIAVPQGVTLHWAGDEEPTWEAGKDYVIQLLQTAPTRIEARLFNAPQGEKTDIFADFVSTYTEALRYPDFTAYAEAHPDWQKQKLLCYPSIWGRTTQTIANPIVYFEPKGNFSGTYLTFEDSSVFININSSVNQGILSNAEIGRVKSLFVIYNGGGNVGGNGGFVFPKNFLTLRDSAVYINLPAATGQSIAGSSYSSFIVSSDIRFLHHVYIHWPKAATIMQIFDDRTPSHRGTNAYAQPLSADSIIYFFTHLPNAPTDGIPIKIGVDATLGEYEADEEGNTVWRPTDAELLAALFAVEDKGWAIAFDPATLD